MSKFNSVLTEDLIISLLNSEQAQNYGSLDLVFKDAFVLEHLEHGIYMFNTIVGRTVYDTIKARPGSDYHYALRYHENNRFGAVLSDIDLNYKKIIDRVVRTGISEKITAGIKTAALAGLYARKNKLVVDEVEDGIVVRVKGANSVYKKIEQALVLKQRKFVISRELLPIKTARVYASMLKSQHGVKCSVTSAGDSMVIYFGYQTARDEFGDKICDTVYKMLKSEHLQAPKSYMEMSIREIINLMPDVVMNNGAIYSGAGYNKHEQQDYRLPEMITHTENTEAYNNQATAVYEDPDDVPEYRIFGYNSQQEFEQAQLQKARSAYVPKPAFVLDPVPAPQNDSDMVILTDEEVDYSKPWVEPVVEPQHGTDHIGLWRIVDGEKIYDHRFEDKVAEVDGLKQYVAPLDEVSKEPKNNEWSFD